MKIALLVGGAIGYVLGAKAGRERYETIVRTGRKVAGSQTVQSTAGVLQAQVDSLSQKARETVAAKLGSSRAGSGGTLFSQPASVSANGYHH
jgi:hypothetical protein